MCVCVCVSVCVCVHYRNVQAHRRTDTQTHTHRHTHTHKATREGGASIADTDLLIYYLICYLIYYLIYLPGREERALQNRISGRIPSVTNNVAML